MRISPQISACSIVGLGHFNPLIFRPEWLRDKEILVGSDFDAIAVDVLHPELVSFKLPWGQILVDRDRFTISAIQEPLVRAQDFFVKCFQFLPETPVLALGMNREVHFPSGSETARDHVGDVLAPKTFWGEFVLSDGKKAGGMRSLVMEQSVAKEGRRARVDGSYGWIQVKVEPSVRPDVSYGIFVQVNDHHDLADNRSADGRMAAELVAEKWDSSKRAAEQLIDKIMELASGA
jgi:hypothetical protein